MMLGQRTVAAVLLVIAPAGGAVAGTTPAWAANEAGLSLDGRAWSSSLSGPLFDADTRWVPGDMETRSFLVRNQGATGSVLTVTVDSGDADRLLALDDIELSARSANGPWVSVHNGQPSQRLTKQILARTGQTRVDLRADFRPESINRSQRKALGLTFVITLTQAMTGGASPDGISGNNAGNLPQTGATIEPWMTWTAAALIGAGLLLVGRRRKEQDNE